jgi:hypothetical protein
VTAASSGSESVHMGEVGMAVASMPGGGEGRSHTVTQLDPYGFLVHVASGELSRSRTRLR